MSPKHVRKNTAEYWKLKFEMAQEIIKNSHEKSLKLNEIPGFLKIDRVKPKISSRNHRVTQVHGSVEGKDVLSLVETIKYQKAKKEQAKADKLEEKRKNTELFLKCKDSCRCAKKPCAAAGLKQCTSCHNVLHTFNLY